MKVNVRMIVPFRYESRFCAARFDGELPCGDMEMKSDVRIIVGRRYVGRKINARCNAASRMLGGNGMI